MSDDDEDSSVWLGSSLDDHRDLPEAAQQRLGYQLNRVEMGLDPIHFRPMPTVGPGVREIKVKISNNNYRLFYVASIGDRVYVLHSFAKNTEQTPAADLSKGKARYQAALDHAASLAEKKRTDQSTQPNKPR